jgi:hypothetical protein
MAGIPAETYCLEFWNTIYNGILNCILLVIYIFSDIFSSGLLCNVVDIWLTTYGCIFCNLLQGIHSSFSPIAPRFEEDAITTAYIYIYIYIYIHIHMVVIAVCQPLHTRHHIKQMHVMLPHYHITTYEDSNFN